MQQPTPENGFDAFASSYDRDLQRGLSLSGESKDYFAEKRARWTARCLSRLGRGAGRVLDFGCGTGGSVAYLRELPGYTGLRGYDPSGESLGVARAQHGHSDVDFVSDASWQEAGAFDLGFANGVFHHITAGQRPGVWAQLFACLRPGGLFALWENNPLNPGTRWVMSRIAFDRDAEPFTAADARRQMRAAGFEVLWSDHLFYFPAPLRWLRPLEPALTKLPLGAQYLTLGRRPEGAGR